MSFNKVQSKPNKINLSLLQQPSKPIIDMQVNVLETPDSLMRDFKEMVDSVTNPSPEKIKVLATNQAREMNVMSNY